MAKLALRDAVLGYDRAGSGPPLVFLHGVGSIREVWRPQLERFARWFTCVALDLRGHGESAAEPETISLESWASDVLEALDALELAPAHLCGLSLGGVVALEVWARRPSAVRSLVLADAWALHREAAAGLPARLASIDSTPLSELARLRIPAVLAPDADTELVRHSIEVMAAKDRASYRRSNEVLWVADERETARTVTVPATVIVGERDVITPAPLSEELAALIPGARLAVIAGAGHLSNADHPDEFNAELERHLRAQGDMIEGGR